MHSLSKLKLSNVLSTQPVLTKFNVQSSTTYYAAFATTNSSTTFISSASKFHNPTTPTTAASIDTKIDKTQEEIKTTNDNREEIEGEGEEEEEGHSQCSSLTTSVVKRKARRGSIDSLRGNSIGEVVLFGGIELDVVEVFVL
ncbi:hypothetical protein LWI29_027018 [Acer saccharum]|uniref:Uncharacterized protein n=1 Tax=Acer saccharum TaxID=4024 RepID=A0AA39RIG7_ACESA|nr:hypothetical protein LWI29_027018 [Acer saccharum]